MCESKIFTTFRKIVTKSFSKICRSLLTLNCCSQPLMDEINSTNRNQFVMTNYVVCCFCKRDNFTCLPVNMAKKKHHLCLLFLLLIFFFTQLLFILNSFYQRSISLNRIEFLTVGSTIQLFLYFNDKRQYFVNIMST